MTAKRFKFRIGAAIFLAAIVLLTCLLIYSREKGSAPTKETLHPALFSEQLENGSVRCNLCPNRCILQRDQTGFCRARKNIDGRLYSLVYGRIASAHVDPIEKKPFFHVLPGSNAYSIATTGCNLRCKFCQNWQISQSFPGDVETVAMTPEEVVDAALKSGAKSIAYTYNEPTIFYEYMLDIARLARKKGLLNVVVSAGYINPEPLRALLPHIDAYKIDLKGYNEEFYKDMVGGRLEPVLQTLKIIKESGTWLEIVNLVVPNENDSIEDIKDLILWVKDNLGADVPLHFTRYHPDYKLLNQPPTPVETLKKAREMAMGLGLSFVYTGNVSYPEGETTFCPKSHQKAIERKGFIVTSNILKDGRCPDGEDIPGIWSVDDPPGDNPEDGIIRSPAVSGSFYPSDRRGLEKAVDQYLKDANPPKIEGRIVAMIVPHAGYLYSGQVAAYAFKTLEGRDIDTVILMGNSHRAAFDGVSVFSRGSFETPLGKVEIDARLADLILKEDKRFKSDTSAHTMEHSLEVEIPFLQRVLKGFRIVPILFGNRPDEDYKSIARAIVKNIKGKNILLLASSDLSHYPAYDDARSLDKEVIDSILTGDVGELDKNVRRLEAKNTPNTATLACGIDAIRAVMEASRELGAEGITLLKSANSGDVSGERSRVVGYAAIVFAKGTKGALLNKTEQEELLRIAKSSVESYVRGGTTPEFSVEGPRLKENLGAFVTLRTGGHLRGCIGRFSPTDIPLYKVVSLMGIAAATEDMRFRPVGKDELKNIDYEISVLSPLTKVKDWKDIRIGIDGVKIVKGNRSGVFLPQVATENNWDLRKFLSELCYQKTGLSPSCYEDKDIELYTFTAQVFGEE